MLREREGEREGEREREGGRHTEREREGDRDSERKCEHVQTKKGFSRIDPF